MYHFNRANISCAIFKSANITCSFYITEIWIGFGLRISLLLTLVGRLKSTNVKKVCLLSDYLTNNFVFFYSFINFCKVHLIMCGRFCIFPVYRQSVCLAINCVVACLISAD